MIIFLDIIKEEEEKNVIIASALKCLHYEQLKKNNNDTKQNISNEDRTKINKCNSHRKNTRSEQNWFLVA